ncbi:hypothetical protein EV361DRAFT_804018 [Lentinula raphanica]|nr:hypothetical protein EV361DRAFT_804018 [Lentinula raphanica]
MSVSKRLGFDSRTVYHAFFFRSDRQDCPFFDFKSSSNLHLVQDFCRLETVVWLVPSLIGNAIAVALVGLFFGPMFPVALSASRKVIPRWIYTGAIGWITGFGQAGSAALPF